MIYFLKQLRPQDYRLRFEYGKNIRRQWKTNSGYMHRIVFSAQCVFNTHGVFNKLNAGVWVLENPHTVEKVPQTSEKVMVWRGMYKSKIIGPSLFSRSNVTSEN